MKKVPPSFETTREEVMAFIGMKVAMGIAKLPSLDDYWKKGIISMPWFRAVMSRNRFRQILRFLHLADNSKQVPQSHPNYDRLYKRGNLDKVLSHRFSEMYAPQRTLSIDEQMIGTKARIGFLQYMPNKPTRFGIKLWALCDSISSYCLQF